MLRSVTSGSQTMNRPLRNALAAAFAILALTLAQIPQAQARYAALGHCQTNLNRPAKGASLRCSGPQLTPLGQGGGTVLSEDVATTEVTVLIEMVMDRGVDGGKLLQSLYVPELRHRTLSSSEWLM